MKIAILTTPNQWFEEYAIEFAKKMKAPLFFDYDNISDYEVVFILSYHKIITKENLNRNKHNIVIHESNLPKGKGWAPLFWQILDGKSEITFTMFEAGNGIDSGDIYMQKVLKLSGHELHEEIRKKQAQLTIEMCIEFLNNYAEYRNPTKQIGKESYYRRRTSKDSELDINKTINEQFNLLRIVNNEKYPAFFYKDGHKYILTIKKDKR